MDLSRRGREYAHWTAKSVATLAAAPEVSFVIAPAILPTTWIASTWDGAETTDSKGRKVRNFKILVYGPDAPVGGGGTPLVLGTHETYVRFTENPETIERLTESITVA